MLDFFSSVGCRLGGAWEQVQELKITAAPGHAVQGGIIPLPEQISLALHGATGQAGEQTLGVGA